jgi:acyl CoA:acetate/3-ketoacid CoA transferase beta subunit
VSSREFSLEDVQIARMSREYKGEIVAIGSTGLADLASKVAKLVHNDDLVILGGNSWACFDADVLPLSAGERGGRPTARGQFDWSLCFDLIAADKFRIFVGPVQIDRSGASNISVVGDWAQPKVQLIGSRGLPDDLWRIGQLHFHVPNQTRRTLVEKVDFVSSFGNGAIRDELQCTTGRPGVLVTNLATFTWPDGGDIVVESIHPGVTAADVQAATGFELQLQGVPVTDPPTADELRAIRYLRGLD